MAKDFGLLDSLGEPQPHDGRAQQVPGVVSPPATHEQQVRVYLRAIAWFTGIVAVATVANFVAQIVLGAIAASQLH